MIYIMVKQSRARSELGIGVRNSFSSMASASMFISLPSVYLGTRFTPENLYLVISRNVAY